ncbi:phage tail protein [Pseudomonas typographi]|uniref:phage tail protein n=1 Tax=Pseudomonas typographi TaxID=2715964 RepID=UPI001689467A|nr:phage tail protein [Pseudomonas typographi]MBD1589788.1 phage tail protein [Pseudomonas typographi]
MSVKIPNGTTFEIAATLGDATPFTAITNANPAVVTAAANGLSDGDVLVVDSGWAKLSGRPARVTAAADDSFSLENINTISLDSYPAGSGAGTYKVATDWTQIAQITEPAANGGDQQFLTYGFLEDDDDRQMPTTKSANSMTLPVADDPSKDFVAIVEEADEDKKPRLIRANLPGGSKIYYYAYVSITATPTLSRNNLMTRTITLSLASRVTRYNAAA